MRFLATDSLLAGDEVRAMYKHDGDWYLIGMQDHLDRPIPGLFHFVDETYVFRRLPQVYGQLDQPDETIINISQETTEVHINKKHFHLGIPTHSARASRQANQRFSFFDG